MLKKMSGIKMLNQKNKKLRVVVGMKKTRPQKEQKIGQNQ
jgi:hypothetical protein